MTAQDRKEKLRAFTRSMLIPLFVRGEIQQTLQWQALQWKYLLEEAQRPPDMCVTLAGTNDLGNENNA